MFSCFMFEITQVAPPAIEGQGGKMLEFVGNAVPLTSTGVGQATQELGITAAQLWAVIQVETGGSGFLPDRRPEILFEHRKFQELTKGNLTDLNPISVIPAMIMVPQE
jgi:hypothetical protein